MALSFASARRPYAEQVAAVVVFVSTDYAVQDWTRLERRAALGRAVRERQRQEYVPRATDPWLGGAESDRRRRSEYRGQSWV